MRVIGTVPKHQAQMLLIPNDIVLHGKDQVAQGCIHGVIIKVFLGGEKSRNNLNVRMNTPPATNKPL